MVRNATPADVPALVRLRLANAERHVQLDPAVYRLPDAELVRAHLERTVSDAVILVAEEDGEVVGMAEVVPRPAAPDHQMIIPRPAADVHTVVLDGHRGRGVGRALVDAAARAAAERGIEILYAGILTANEDAVRFYTSAGFRPRGTVLSRHDRRGEAG